VAERVPGAEHPQAAGPLVNPDPVRLEKAAAVALDAELIASGDAAPGIDPGANDPAWAQAEGEAPLVAAVDLVNQARFVVDMTGTCVDCRSPLDFLNGPHNGPAEDPDVHLVEP
jgi:hypothetical protein